MKELSFKLLKGTRHSLIKEGKVGSVTTRNCKGSALKLTQACKIACLRLSRFLILLAYIHLDYKNAQRELKRVAQ